MQSTLLWLFQRHKAYHSPTFPQEVLPQSQPEDGETDDDFLLLFKQQAGCVSLQQVAE